jgi:hypothetical protein
MGPAAGRAANEKITKLLGELIGNNNLIASNRNIYTKNIFFEWGDECESEEEVQTA